MSEASMSEGKKYLVRQYRPAYFTGFDTQVITVDGFDQITTAPWLENFKSEGFTHFTVSDYYGELIIEAHYADGKHWVAGFALPEDSEKMSNNGDLLRDNWRYKNHTQ